MELVNYSFVSTFRTQSFEVRTAMKIQVEVFCAVTPRSVVIRYQLFGGSCCLHLQVVTPCNVVVGYQRFGEPSCLHPQGSLKTASMT